MVSRILAGFVASAAAVVAMAACGGDIPRVEDLGREIEKQTPSDFNDGFRSTCEARGLGRFTGGLSDDVCECALRVVREEVAEDDLVPREDGGIDLPEAVEKRSLEVCLGEEDE